MKSYVLVLTLLFGLNLSGHATTYFCPEVELTAYTLNLDYPFSTWKKYKTDLYIYKNWNNLYWRITADIMDDDGTILKTKDKKTVSDYYTEGVLKLSSSLFHTHSIYLELFELDNNQYELDIINNNWGEHDKILTTKCALIE
jgi:hypothetical protein